MMRQFQAGDLVRVRDDRLISNMSIGVISHINITAMRGIISYRVFCEGKEINVVRPQIFEIHEER